MPYYTKDPIRGANFDNHSNSYKIVVLRALVIYYKYKRNPKAFAFLLKV